jgi:hypothetical protein
VAPECLTNLCRFQNRRPCPHPLNVESFIPYLTTCLLIEGVLLAEDSVCHEYGPIYRLADYRRNKVPLLINRTSILWQSAKWNDF